MDQWKGQEVSEFRTLSPHAVLRTGNALSELKKPEINLRSLEKAHGLPRTPLMPSSGPSKRLKNRRKSDCEWQSGTYESEEFLSTPIYSTLAFLSQIRILTQFLENR